MLSFLSYSTIIGQEQQRTSVNLKHTAKICQQRRIGCKILALMGTLTLSAKSLMALFCEAESSRGSRTVLTYTRD